LVDAEAAALVVRQEVFSFLHAEGLLSEERTQLLLSWRHSGFSVRSAVTVPPDDRDGLERLACDLLRAPVILERLSFGAASDRVAYARRPGRGHEPGPAAGDLTDPRKLLVRVLLHIPEPRRHVIRYHGAYSSVARARRARQRAAPASDGTAAAPPPDVSARQTPSALHTATRPPRVAPPALPPSPLDVVTPTGRSGQIRQSACPAGVP